MITIEEKLKLFTKIVYDKVEKENKDMIEKFNEEYGNMIERRKQEFNMEAEKITFESRREIEKEEVKILSRARIEEKRIILQKRKEIFEDFVKEIENYAEAFTNKKEYEELFFNYLGSVRSQVKGLLLDMYITKADFIRFENMIGNELGDIKINYHFNDEIIGGFLVLDQESNIKFDMSLKGRINESKEFMGKKLFEILQ